MKTLLGSRKISPINSALLGAVMLWLCLVAALSCGLFRGAESSQRAAPRTNTFELAQFEADTRTLAAALRYVLEPEPPDPKPDFASNGNLRALPSQSRGQMSPCFVCVSNCCRLGSTNRPASG